MKLLLLLLLPMLPLLAALWMALTSRHGNRMVGRVVIVLALVVVAVAVLMPAMRVEHLGVLLIENTAMQLDEIGRAALLLFGGLWLAVGLLLTRMPEPGPHAAAVLVAFSGVLTLVLAEGSVLIYSGLLVTGYGLYAIMAGEPDPQWRRAGRALIVVLVISDLLVFEVLLASASYPGVDLKPYLVVMLMIALILRSGLAPAHVWLPPALAATRTPAAVLLVAVPPAAALLAGLRLLPADAEGMRIICLAIGLLGAPWAVVVGLSQRSGRATLGYAVLASASVLLLALPASIAAGQGLAWLILAMMTTAASVPVIALLHADRMRLLALTIMAVIHALAAIHTSQLATTALPGWAGWLAPLVAISATALLILAGLRSSNDHLREEPESDLWPIAILGVLGCTGLGFAWTMQAPTLAAFLMAPAGLAAGLILYRLLPGKQAPLIAPGDWLGLIERFGSLVGDRVEIVCSQWLPRWRDQFQTNLAGLWRGEFWSNWIERIDLRLQIWSATSVLLLATALGAAYLLM